MNTATISERTHKLISRIEAMASISENENGIYRPFASKSGLKCHDLIFSWCKSSQLIVKKDAIGNLIISQPDETKHTRSFYMGSHIDTVVNAGKYDGILGFLLALDQLENNHQGLPFNLRAIAFSDEEGARYSTAYLGSGVFSGCFDMQLLDRKDDLKISMKEAITQFGGKIEALSNDHEKAESFAGYLEVHIEQGPVLEDRNVPIGVVEKIAGQCRALMTYRGKAGHAGTVPMLLRKDASMAAAELAMAVESYAKEHTSKLVATTAKWTVAPNAGNVIPDYAQISLDLRSGDSEFLKIAYQKIHDMAKEIGESRGLGFEWDLTLSNDPVEMDLELKERLGKAVTAGGIENNVLNSGAGHDAVVVANLGPVAMLFVRCKEGISHHPDESVTTEDIMKTIEVCDHFFETYK